MHFNSLYIIKDKHIKDMIDPYIFKNGDIENMLEIDTKQFYSINYCDCCGERQPRIYDFCDWFSIGGRYEDVYFSTNKGKSFIAEIKDIKNELKKEQFYSIIIDGELPIIQKDPYETLTNEKKFEELLNKINKKEIQGIAIVIDNHM